MRRETPTQPTRPPWRRLRTAAGVALMVLAAPGCAQTGGEALALNDALEAEQTAPPVDVGTSLTGNYLAGRQAQMRRDMPAAAHHLMEAVEKDPDNQAILRRAFLVTAAEGRFEQAFELAHRLGKLGDMPATARLVLAAGDIRKGEFARAAGRLEGMPDRGLNVFMVPLMRAWALAGTGDDAAALEALKPLTDNEGFRPLYDLHAALIQDLAGNTRAATEHFEKTYAAQDDPTLRLVQLMGNHMERLGRPERARELYLAYQKEHGAERHLAPPLKRLQAAGTPQPDVDSAADGAAEALFGIASSLRQQNMRDTALVFGRLALHLRPDFPMVQVLVGSLLEADDRLQAANQIYAAIDPDSPFAWSARLRRATNLDSLGETDAAVAQLQDIAERYPEEPDPLIDMGDILRRHERFDEAVAAYDRAVKRIGELQDRHWSLLYARGIALERADNWPRAEADFLQALEFRPDQPYVLNYLGYSWVEKGMHLERAQEMIQRAVELRPNDGYIVDSLGWIYYQLGKYRRAVRELERAVELRPDDPVINDHLGDAYWRVERKQEARFQWKRALGLEPETDLENKIRTKLKKGLKAPQPITATNG